MNIHIEEADEALENPFRRSDCEPVLVIRHC